MIGDQIMKWFKFYGQDFFTDPKVMMLTSAQRLMFIGLMSIAAQEDKNNEAEGIIPWLSEERVMNYVGIEYGSEAWDECKNAFTRLANLGFISIDTESETMTINNYHKLQKSNQTASERVMESRKRKQRVNKSVNSVKQKFTLDKDIDKDKDIDNTVSTNGDKNLLKKLPDVLQDKEHIDVITDFLVKELNDERSRAYYRLVACKVPEGFIRQTVSEISQDGADDPRKVFTFRMSKYALTIQVQL